MQETNHYKTLLIEEANPVMWVTMNRPDSLNTLNILMAEELADFFHGGAAVAQRKDNVLARGRDQ